MTRQKNDNQKLLVYEAEEVLRQFSNIKFRKIETIQKWVDINIVNNPKITKKYAHASLPITVRKSRSLINSFGDVYGIRLRPQAYCEWIALHEVAHVIQIRKNEVGTYAFHDETFTDIYLFLVNEIMGERPHRYLKKEFDRLGIVYSKPKRSATANLLLTLLSFGRKLNT